jgi:hypothetical protein
MTLPCKKMIVAKFKEVKTGRFISRHIWQNLLKQSFSIFVRSRPGKLFFSIRQGPGTGPRPGDGETLFQRRLWPKKGCFASDADDGLFLGECAPKFIQVHNLIHTNT